jgi:putative tryptophan/tyrosine transport system substrate-binding protein
MPVIGFLHNQSPEPFAFQTDAFRNGLSDMGFIEGRNISIEYRWARGQHERLSALAADLVRRQVAVIATGGGAVVAQAAKAATPTIPVVFVSGGDPVKLGLVASFNRPGANVTGVTPFFSALGAKRLELLHELVPSATVVGVLFNPDSLEAEAASRDAQTAAPSLGLQLILLTARTEADFQVALGALAQQRGSALLVNTDTFFTSQRDHLLALTARYAIPAIYDAREFVAADRRARYDVGVVRLPRFLRHSSRQTTLGERNHLYSPGFHGVVVNRWRSSSGKVHSRRLKSSTDSAWLLAMKHPRKASLCLPTIYL